MIKNLTTYTLRLMSLPKIQTDLLWYLTILFCGLGMAYFIFVFLFRNRISTRTKKVSDKKRELAPMISQFLFFEEDASKEEREEYLRSKVEIRQQIKSGFDRAVLAEILMDLQKDVSGEARRRLYDLYKGLDLHQDAFAKLKSWRWEVVSQGILELTRMRVEDAYMFIRRFINHRKGVIRKQAQIATVTLKHEGITYFLDTCRYRISEWQQLKLLDVIRHLEDFEPPRFKIWLTSKNPDVVLFALRLIRYYNQNDANPAIIQLIKHRNSQIKLEAIQCLKLFGVSESIDTLKTSFLKCNTDAKIAVLDAIGSLGSIEDIDFLKKIENSNENFTVKSKALTAINSIDPSLILPMESIQEPEAEEIAYAKEPAPAQDEEVNIHSNMEENICEEDREEEIPEIPELFMENEAIFDLCCQEEFRDILEDSKLEEDPEYLPLDFLPLVDEGDSMPDMEELTPESKRSQEEESFKKSLDTILNKITMKKDRKPKINDELPEFIPLVVPNQENVESSATADSLTDLEVDAEHLDIPEDRLDFHKEEADGSDSIPEEEIEELPDDRSALTWEDLLEARPPEITSDTDVNSTGSEELTEDLLGFCIFHEMFRDFDTESKLILLDEILVVGEEKELRFLETLSKDPEKKIRQKAQRIKERLAEKLQLSLVEETVETGWEQPPAINSVEVEAHIVEAKSSEQDMPEVEGEKMPLEYCFYEPARRGLADDMVPAFEPEISDIQQAVEEIPDETNIATTVPEKKSAGLLENLLAFTLKLRERRNG